VKKKNEEIKKKDEEIKKKDEEIKKKNEEIKKLKEKEKKEGLAQKHKPNLFLLFLSSLLSRIMPNLVVNSKIKFIKPLDDVIIQGRIITFTKYYKNRTVFINKMINSRIVRMFISFIYIYIFYFVREVLCICTDSPGYFSMRNSSFYFIFF
jgi:hypothetical protein